MRKHTSRTGTYRQFSFIIPLTFSSGHFLPEFLGWERPDRGTAAAAPLCVAQTLDLPETLVASVADRRACTAALVCYEEKSRIDKIAPEKETRCKENAPFTLRWKCCQRARLVPFGNTAPSTFLLRAGSDCPRRRRRRTLLLPPGAVRRKTWTTRLPP